MKTIANGSLKTLVDTKSGLETRVNAIKEINIRYNFECYNDKGEVINADLLADATLKTAISTAINNLKSEKDSTGATIAPATELSNAKTAIANAKTQYQTLTNAKSTAKGNICLTIVDTDTTAKKAFAETLRTEVLEKYINIIDAVTLEEFTADNAIFTNTQTEAVKAVKTYIEDNMKAYVTDTINKKIQDAVDAGNTIDEEKTAEAFITANATTLTLSGATTDALVTAASSAKTTIDTAISSYSVVK